jgi:hypothetical protein
VSLVLYWENPAGLIDLNVRKVVIWRIPADGSAAYIVNDDACWGMAVDSENSDPAAMYEIEYLGSRGERKAYFPDDQIQRWERPDKSCLITWQLTKQDGSPDANRSLEISDRHVTGNFIRRLTTNHAGKAQFVAVYGQRLTYFLEGDLYELDAAAPALREVTSDQLRADGSLLIRDHRAWF